MSNEWVDVEDGPTNLGTITPGHSEDGWVDVQSNSGGWNAVDSAKQFASGAVEGTTGLFALMADLEPVHLAQRAAQSVFDDSSSKGQQLFPASITAKKLTDKLLSEEDPQYRYARTAGQFVGPGGIGGAIGKAKSGAGPLYDWLAKQIGKRAVATNTSAAVSAQGAEDLTGDTVVAPLVASIFGAAGPSVFADVVKGIKSSVTRATPAQLRGSAAHTLREYTGLTPQQIEAAIANRPRDSLGTLMSTAEITDNAGMAQIEKELAGTGAMAGEYAQRSAAREGARGEMLDQMSATSGVNREGLGTALMTRANKTGREMDLAAEKLWKEVPRHEPVYVGDGQAAIGGILNAKQAGLEPGSKVRTLVGQFLGETEDDIFRSSGALQDIRSDALMLLRDQNLTATEQRVLSALQAEIDDAMEQGLKGANYDKWVQARTATATRAETFGRGTAGGSLTADTARPANVLRNAFKGDSQAVKELRTATQNDPALLEDMKRGVIDMIPRDSQGRLTPDKMRKFLAANEGGLKELFGEQHYGAMNRILSDLQSEARVAQTAHLASKGNSVTAQRQTVAGKIHDMMVGSFLPGSGLLAKAFNHFKEAIGEFNENAVKEMLFRAAMEPQFALELAKAPTSTRIFSVMEKLHNMATDAAAAGGKAGAIELARTQEGTKKPADGSHPSVFRPIGNVPANRNSSGQSSGPAPTRLEPTLAEGSLGPTSQQRPTVPEQTSTQGLQQGRNNIQGRSSVFSPINYRYDDRPDMRENQGQVPPGFLDTVLDSIEHVESRGKVNAVSEKGAQGPYQLMPETGREFHRKLGLKEAYDPFNRSQARKIASAIILEHLERFDGDWQKAITAYHSGAGNVKAGKLGPRGREYYGLVEKQFSKLLKA